MVESIVGEKTLLAPCLFRLHDNVESANRRALAQAASIGAISFRVFEGNIAALRRTASAPVPSDGKMARAPIETVLSSAGLAVLQISVRRET